MESSNFNTSSSRNKWDCGTSCTTCERRNISSAIAIWIRWEAVVRFFGMLLLSAKCPRLPGRRENTLRKAIRRIIQKTIIPFGALMEFLPSSARDQSRILQLGKKVLPWIFPGYAWIAELEILEASEIYSRRLNAKEVLITQRKGEFVFPVADGSAKLSGRDPLWGGSKP